MRDVQKLRFEEIADPNHQYAIGDGDHGSISTECYQDSGIPYIRVADMVDDRISMDKMVYIPEEVHLLNAHQELVPGDIIIAKTGATIGKIAIIPESIPRANTTASIGKISLDSNKVDTHYFFHYLLTHAFTSQMWKVSHKSAQPGFNVNNLKNFTIDLPSLEEQRSIAAILDKAYEVEGASAQVSVKKMQLIRSAFTDIFGDVGSNERNYPTKVIADVVTNLTSGFAAGKRDENGLVQLRMPNFGVNGEISYAELTRIPRPEHLDEHYLLVDGDVLFNNTNSKEWVGKAGIFRGYSEPVTFSNHFTKLRVDRTVMTPEFMVHWMQRQLDAGFFLSICNKWVNQAAINNTMLSKLTIPVPPLELQYKFSEFLTFLIKSIDLTHARNPVFEILAESSSQILMEV